MLRVEFDLKNIQTAVIYARMSSDRQNPRSPDQQITTIEEVMRRNGFSWTVARIYRDDAISGQLTRKRPQFQRMLNDLRSGAVPAQLILVDTFERLSRSDDGPHIRRRLAKIGVLVLTADSNFSDPTSPAGRALSAWESLRSTEDTRIKAHNVLRGKKDAVRQKHWAGGAAPLGYRLKNVVVSRHGVEEIDHRVLEPNPETRWMIEEIFRLADAHGWGTGKLARHLNQDTRIVATFKPFHPATIGQILDRELYYGDYVWGKNCTGIIDDVCILQPLPTEEWLRIADYCEPLISREIWERVQQLRQARRQRSRHATVIGPRPATLATRVAGIALRYPLTGLVRCAACGRSMIPSSTGPYTAKSGEKRRYVAYFCPGVPGGLCHNSARISEPWLLENIMTLIRGRLFDCDDG